MKIITMTTDFGDYYAAQMKGVLFREEIAVVDICNSIKPDKNAMDVAAYLLLHAADKFPTGTVHIAIVDPGVGSGRKALAIETERYWFVGPDNGILAPAAEKDGIKSVHEIDSSLFENVSRTFHGKDLFAPAALGLLKGDTSMLRKTEHWQSLDLSTKAFINRFGNIELPVSEEIVSVNGIAVKNYETYTDAGSSELFSVIDSRGLRELAVRSGRAADTFSGSVTVKTKSGEHCFELIELGV